MAERICEQCKRLFVPKTGTQRFCKPVCREAHREKTKLVRRRTVPQPARYGSVHQKLRAGLAPAVAAGQVSCCRCGDRIEPGEAWHLDHADDGSYLGAAHAGCNMSAGGRAAWEAQKPADRFPGWTLPDPEPNNDVSVWSRHWGGPANPRCPRCRVLGGPCEDAA